jgi:hypothetical protein
MPLAGRAEQRDAKEPENIGDQSRGVRFNADRRSQQDVAWFENRPPPLEDGRIVGAGQLV